MLRETCNVRSPSATSPPTPSQNTRSKSRNTPPPKPPRQKPPRNTPGRFKSTDSTGNSPVWKLRKEFVKKKVNVRPFNFSNYCINLYYYKIHFLTIFVSMWRTDSKSIRQTELNDLWHKFALCYWECLGLL